jgi:hypothetical protein
LCFFRKNSIPPDVREATIHGINPNSGTLTIDTVGGLGGGVGFAANTEPEKI